MILLGNFSSMEPMTDRPTFPFDHSSWVDENLSGCDPWWLSLEGSVLSCVSKTFSWKFKHIYWLSESFTSRRDLSVNASNIWRSHAFDVNSTVKTGDCWMPLAQMALSTSSALEVHTAACRLALLNVLLFQMYIKKTRRCFSKQGRDNIRPYKEYIHPENLS